MVEIVRGEVLALGLAYRDVEVGQGLPAQHLEAPLYHRAAWLVIVQEVDEEVGLHLALARLVERGLLHLLAHEEREAGEALRVRLAKLVVAGKHHDMGYAYPMDRHGTDHRVALQQLMVVEQGPSRPEDLLVEAGVPDVAHTGLEDRLEVKLLLQLPVEGPLACRRGGGVAQVAGDVVVGRVDHEDGVVERPGRLLDEVLQPVIGEVGRQHAPDDVRDLDVLYEVVLQGVVAREGIRLVREHNDIRCLMPLQVPGNPLAAKHHEVHQLV